MRDLINVMERCHWRVLRGCRAMKECCHWRVVKRDCRVTIKLCHWGMVRGCRDTRECCHWRETRDLVTTESVISLEDGERLWSRKGMLSLEGGERS